MGIMSYTVTGSDNCADMATDIYEKILKRLQIRIKRSDNEYNTDGTMDVAMFIDEALLKQIKLIKVFYRRDFRDLGEDCKKRLQQHIDAYLKLDKEAKKGCKAYYNSLRRLKVSVGKFVRKLK